MKPGKLAIPILVLTRRIAAEWMSAQAAGTHSAKAYVERRGQMCRVQSEMEGTLAREYLGRQRTAVGQPVIRIKVPPAH